MVYLSESKEEAYWGFGKQSCSRALSSSHLCFLFYRFTVVRPVSGVLFFLYFFNPNYWERKFDWFILTQGWSSSEPINSSQGSMTAKHNFSEKILVGKVHGFQRQGFIQTSFNGVVYDFVGNRPFALFMHFDGGRPLEQRLLGSSHVSILFLTESWYPGQFDCKVLYSRCQFYFVSPCTK